MDPADGQTSTTANVTASIDASDKVLGKNNTLDTKPKTTMESVESQKVNINGPSSTDVGECVKENVTSKSVENTAQAASAPPVVADAQKATNDMSTDETNENKNNNIEKSDATQNVESNDTKMEIETAVETNAKEPVEDDNAATKDEKSDAVDTSMEVDTEKSNTNSSNVEDATVKDESNASDVAKPQAHVEKKEESNASDVAKPQEPMEKKEESNASDVAKPQEPAKEDTATSETKDNLETSTTTEKDVKSDASANAEESKVDESTKTETNTDESTKPEASKSEAHDPPQASQATNETVPDESPSTQLQNESAPAEDSTAASQPPATPAAAPKTVILRPSLRGHLKVVDSILTWEGNWGMDDNAFAPGGFISPFKYCWTKDAVPAAPGEPDGDKSLPMGLKDSYFSGYFIMGSTQPGVGTTKIEEKNLLFKFRASEADSSIIIVEGTGRNKFGSFQLDGTFDSTSKELNVHRTYATKPKAASRSKSRKSTSKKTPGTAAPRSTPRTKAPPSIPRGLNTGDIVFHARRTDRVRRAPTHLAEEDDSNPLGKIARLVQTMLTQDKEGYFSSPVDPVKLKIPTYTKIITSPMDLGTISSNLADKIYEDEEQVAEHVQLTYKNAMKFNPKTHLLHGLAKQYLDMFNREYSKIAKEREREATKSRRKGSKGSAPSYVAPKSSKSKKRKNTKTKKAKKAKKRSKAVFSDSESDSDVSDESGESEISDSSDSDSDSDSSSDEDTHKRKRKKSKRRKAVKRKKMNEDKEKISALQAQLSMLSQQVKTLKSQPKPVVHHHVTAPVGHHPVAAPKVVKKKRNSRPLSYQDKRQLVADIRKLPSDQIQKVLNIIRETGAPLGGDGEEVELDFDLLETSALRRIQRFVRSCLTKEKAKMLANQSDD